MLTRNTVLLSIYEKDLGNVLIVRLWGSVSCDNLFQLVRKHFKITSQSFDLDYLENESFPYSLPKTRNLESIFDIDKDCIFGNHTHLPRPIMTSLCDEMLEEIPLRNRLEIKVLPSSDDESQQPNNSSNSEDDGSVIGLSCMQHTDSDPCATQKPNTCTAIVLADPSSCERSSSVNAVLRTDTVISPVPQNFVGLVNSGMTCYMNSLLQTLFMTPEFRNALYHWRFEGNSTEAVTSIPYQLQRLFVQLQTTESTAISTNGVTTSFGWRSCDVIQQQDIHELCRVLFDALEKKLGCSKTASSKDNNDYKKSAGDEQQQDRDNDDDGADNDLKKKKTSGSTFNLINRLYQGERSDYVRCLYCNRVSWRPDTFLDIQVPLRSFELNAKPYESLEAAFRALIKPERLEGNNQYWCSYCECKRDAERGCAFHKMPYLLTLQLMRFTFDPQTLNRIKLNDKFTFPLDRLDLSEFVTTPTTNTTTNNTSEKCESPETGIERQENTSENGDTEADNDHGLVYSHSSTKTNVQNNGENNCLPVTNENVISSDTCSDCMETEATDSGVNSNTDSPFDGVSSGSPTVGSPNVEEEMDDLSDFGGDATHTVTNNSVLMKAVLTVQQNMNDITERNHNKNNNNHNHINNDSYNHRIYSSSNELDDGIASECTCPSCSCSTTTVHQKRLTNECHNRKKKQRRHRSHSPQNRSPQKFKTSRSVNDNTTTSHETATTTTTTSTTTSNDDNPGTSESNYDVQSNTSDSSLVYELFSIMVHSGSINGGHYYAFIKSFNDGLWYKFNDQYVTPTSLEALESTFGTNQSSYFSHSNAYFLMYRLVNPELNETFMKVEEFPEHIHKMMQEIRDEERGVAEKKERELMVCKFEAYARCPVTQNTIHANVTLYKDQSMSQATNVIRQTLLPNLNKVPQSAFRIVQYNSSDDSLGKSAEYVLNSRPRFYSSNNGSHSNETESSMPMDMVTVGEFSNNKAYYPFPLWLEHHIHVPGSVKHLFSGSSSSISQPVPQMWRTYEPGGITFNVSRVDFTCDVIYPSEKIWLPLSGSVYDLIFEIWQLYTGEQSIDEELIAGPTTNGLQIILDKSFCQCPSNSMPQNQAYHLPEWAVILYTCDYPSSIVDSPFSEIINFTHQSNCSTFAKSYPSGSFNLYVDIGAAYDGYCDPVNNNSDMHSISDTSDIDQDENNDENNNDGMIADSNILTEPSHNGRCDVGGKRGRWQMSDSRVTTTDNSNNNNANNIKILPAMDLKYRLHKICSVAERYLYHTTLSVIIPSEAEIASFLVQREFLANGKDTPGSSSSSDSKFMNSTPSDSHDVYQITSKTESVSHSVSPMMKASASLDNVTASMNSFDVTVNTNDMSPPDSRCSIHAQYGSLHNSEKSVSLSSTSSVSSSPSLENIIESTEHDEYPLRRRSNSQPSLINPFNEKLAETTTTAATEHRVSSLVSESNRDELDSSLVAMDVDSSSVHQPSSSDVAMGSNTAIHELETNQRLCCFDDTCTPGTSVYFNASTLLRTIQVHLDVRLSIEEFVKKASEYLKLDAEYLNVIYDGGILRDFTTFDPNHSLRITLSPCVSIEEFYLPVYVLDLEGDGSDQDQHVSLSSSSISPIPTTNTTTTTTTQETTDQKFIRISPIWSNQINLMFRIGWSVEKILKCASSVLKHVYKLDIPPNRLRLRKCAIPELIPGPVFDEVDIFAALPNQHQSLMLQLLSEKHIHTIFSPPVSNNAAAASNPSGLFPSSSSSTAAASYAASILPSKPRICSIFLRQWHPANYSFGEWHELLVTYYPASQSRWEILVDWLVQHTGLPSQRLEVAFYKLPGVIHCLNMSSSNKNNNNNNCGLQWLPCSRYPDMLLSFAAGNIIFFRDVEEESKTIKPTDMETLNQSEISRLNTLMSPWHSQGVLPPPSILDSQFATWSQDPACLSTTTTTSYQGDSSSNNSVAAVPGSIVASDGSGGGGANMFNRYGYYGPYLPQSHESTSTTSTPYPFSSSTYNKSREQPLRIYTAEDISSPVSCSSNNNNNTHHKITGDKHASTGPSSPKCTRSRDSRTP